ncbi:MAG: AI-2E family transporter [Alphaproteobacteria bacterium]
MSKFKNNFFWISILFISIVGLYYIKDILFPFILSVIIAYIFHPLETRLNTIIKSKNLTVSIIIIFFILIFTLIFSLIIPKIYNELNNLISRFADYKLVLQNKIPSNFVNSFFNGNQGLQYKIEDSITSVANYLFKYIISILQNVWNSSLSILNLISLIFLTPIISFYFLRDYNKIILSFNNFIPKSKIEIFKTKFKLIDNILHNYLRGQMNVCLLLIIYYYVCFKILNFESSLLLGMVCGILIIIPYIGIIISSLTTIIVAIIQFPNLSNIGVIILVFVIGQIIEGNFITPKLIGDKIGLHPVWIIFSMLVCGNIFGLVGMILAIPIAAILKILIETLLENYYQSGYYKN